MISRLKLESGEFDSKIARATKGLLTMEKECREVGGTLAILDKEQLEFVRGLGQMETVTQNAKGKVAELTAAYTELSIQYNRLTKEEKNGDYGRALASSLDQLKRRIKDSKSELSGVEGKLSGFGDVANTVGSKLGIPVSALSGVGAAAAAAGAALKVAKDAFLATEGGIDEWGRTVEGAKGAYSVFLDTLNNGNWSNFFSNLSNAIKGSRQLYDEMDRLSSIKANNAAAIAKEQATIQELRLRQQKGENVAAELRAAEERLRKLQTESVDQGKTVGRDQMKQAITNSVNSIKGNGSSFLGINFRKDTTAKVSDEQINAAIDDILNNGQAAMDKYAQAFKDLQTKGTKTWTETQYSQGGVAYQVTKSEFDINQLSAEEQALYKLSKAITDTETKLQEGIGTYTQALQEEASTNREAFQTERFAQKGDRATAAAAKVEEKAPEGSIKAMREQLSGLQKDWELATDDDSRKVLKDQIDEVSAALDKMIGKTKEAQQVTKAEPLMNFSEKGLANLGSQIKGKMSSAEIGSEDYKMAAENMLDFTTFENLLKAATERGVQPDPEWMASLFEDIKIGADVDPETWQAVVDSINEMIEGTEFPAITLNVKTGGIEAAEKDMDKLSENVQGAIGAFGQLGGAIQQIDDPAAQVAGIIMQAVANVAASFAKSLLGAVGPWDWIAAAIGGVSTMISTIAAIKSATSGGFANGGIVPGNSFSGDNLRTSDYGINAGELILNRAQQGAIAGQLQGAAQQTIVVTGKLSGRDIRLSANNDNRSRGGDRNFYSKIH